MRFKLTTEGLGEKGLAGPRTPVSLDSGQPAEGAPCAEQHSPPPGCRSKQGWPLVRAARSDHTPRGTRALSLFSVRGEVGASRRRGEDWRGPVRSTLCPLCPSASSSTLSRIQSKTSQPEPLRVKTPQLPEGKSAAGRPAGARVSRPLPIPPALEPVTIGFRGRAAPGGSPAAAPQRGAAAAGVFRLPWRCPPARTASSVPAGGVARGVRAGPSAPSGGRRSPGAPGWRGHWR